MSRMRFRLLVALLAVSCCACTFTSERTLRHLAVPLASDVNAYLLVQADSELLEYHTFSHNPFIPFAYGGATILITTVSGHFEPGQILSLPGPSSKAELYRIGHGWSHRPPELLGGFVRILRSTPAFTEAELLLHSEATPLQIRGRFKFRNSPTWRKSKTP